jgi:hypothetical protein
MNEAPKRDPYADVGEVYAEETSRRRVPRIQPTQKTPTEGQEDETTSRSDWWNAITPEDQQGFHIDGDKSYE